MQRLLALALSAVVIALVAAGPRLGTGAQEVTPAAAEGATAGAVLVDTDGNTVGTALLSEQADGTV